MAFRIGSGALRTRLLISRVVILLPATVFFGCGESRVEVRPVFGNVTSDGQTVDGGRVRFVPIEGTRGPASTAK